MIRFRRWTSSHPLAYTLLMLVAVAAFCAAYVRIVSPHAILFGVGPALLLLALVLVNGFAAYRAGHGRPS